MSEPQSQPVGFAWLTLEWLLYALIFAVALGLRLWQLGAYPLSDIEAQQSLLALALYHGDLPDAGQYNPLLVSLNALTFLLLGSSDASARLAAVLLGMLLVILPMTLRRQLGVWVSLLASGLLAISPIAIFFSRTLNSEVGVAAGALMVMTGFLNWITDRQQRWLLLQATGLALMLAAGPMAFSMLIIFGLIVFLQFPALKVLWASSEVESGNASRRAGIFFVVALILFSTAALFNLSGLGVLTTNLPNWFNRFGLTPQPNAGFNAVFSLTIYESLLIFAGLAGLAMTIVRRNLLMVTFSIWFIGLLVLDIVMVGRPNSNVVLLVVPLAFLAASALAELREGLKQYATWQNEGLILVAGLAIAGFGYIGLTGWVFRTCGSDDLFCQYAWLQAIAALALFLIIAITFWYMSGGGVTIRGLALTGVAIGLLITINTGWRLNYGPLMHLAYQPLANTPASTELVMLSDILARQSAERVGDETLLDVTLAGVDSPALQWQLHKYRHLQEGTNIDAPATAIITPAETELSLDQPYLGQDFALNAHWSPVGLPPKALLKWLIYRRADTQPNGEEVILWLRVTDN